MFDISFTELMLIGVIALIVIGPERLPKVARTVGHLLGRAQKYVNEVKSDIQSEMDLKEISDIKKQMEDAAQSVKSSMTSSMDDIKSAVSEPADSLKDSLNQAKEALNFKDSDSSKTASDANDSNTTTSDSNAPVLPDIPEPANLDYESKDKVS